MNPLLTRRELLVGAAFAGTIGMRAEAVRARLHLGAMDGVLRKPGSPAAFAEAARFGLDGVQLTLGRTPDAEGRLPLENTELQSSLRAAATQHGVAIDATYIDILHVNCLKSDPLAYGWVERGIEVTRALGAPILMTVFFGKCAVITGAELEHLGRAFRELAGAARDAGVTLGFENVLTGEDNLRLCDRVNSPAFKIYYDVGNSTNMVRANVPGEIRDLGSERICQFHFKDLGFLGQGKVEYPAILDAIRAIGFDGYANLETNSPSGEWQADLRRNIAFLRPLLQARSLDQPGRQ